MLTEPIDFDFLGYSRGILNEFRKGDELLSNDKSLSSQKLKSIDNKSLKTSHHHKKKKKDGNSTHTPNKHSFFSTHLTIKAQVALEHPVPIRNTPPPSDPDNYTSSLIQQLEEAAAQEAATEAKPQ